MGTCRLGCLYPPRLCLGLGQSVPRSAMAALPWGPENFVAEPGEIRRDKDWSPRQAAGGRGEGVRKEAQPRRTSGDGCPL